MTEEQDAARRAFWTQKMDEASRFMQEVLGYPVKESLKPLVYLPDAAQAAGVEIWFSSLPHAGGRKRLDYLREDLVSGLLDAARSMGRRGWLLKIEDAYRTLEIQQNQGRRKSLFEAICAKVCWECQTDRPPEDVLFRRLSALVANWPRTGTHLSGSAVDISVICSDTHTPVDRGAPYLEMSERTPMDSPFIPAGAQENRAAITRIMRAHGFVAYPWEFWHYSAGDAYGQLLNHTGQPARYGPVHLDAAAGTVVPVERQTDPLNTPEDVSRLLRLFC